MELTISKNKTSKQLLWIGIAAIIMFFAGLTSAYVVRKAEGNWLEYVMPIWFMLSTIAIIVSKCIVPLKYANKAYWRLFQKNDNDDWYLPRFKHEFGFWKEFLV